MDSEKYFKQIEAIEQMAKEECIQILKNNPNGRYIDFDLYNINEESDAWQDMSGMFHVEQVNGEDGTIHICAIGVDENDRLVFKAEQYESPYNDGEWFEIYEHYDTRLVYTVAYRCVVNYLKFAKKEPLPKEEK